MRLGQFQLLLTLIIVQAVSGIAQNRAVYLDGYDDYVDIGVPVIQTSKFTIEAWAWMEGTGGGYEGQNCIFQQRANPTGCYYSKIVLNATAYDHDASSRFHVTKDMGCGETAITSAPAFGEWHHYAAVYCGNTATLYIDGSIAAETTVMQEGSLFSNIVNIAIGRHNYANTVGGSFYGYLDEVRIWADCRGENTIREYMYSTLDGDEPALMAYWNFDDGSAQDLTANSADGTLMHGASIVDIELPGLCEPHGDINGDREISLADILIYVQYLLGMDTGGVVLECTDLNEDGIITLSDLQVIVDLLLGTENP